MRCTRCGFVNYDGVKICKNCGAPLNNTLLNQQNYANQQNYNTQQNINNLQYQPIKEDYNNIKVYKEKKPIGKIIVVLALVISMVLMLFGVVYLYLENHGFFDTDKKTTITETTNEEDVDDKEKDDKETTNETSDDKKDDKNDKEDKEPIVEEDEDNKDTNVDTTQDEKVEENTPNNSGFFGSIEDYESVKLIGSKDVGYMIIPSDMNIQKIDGKSIEYLNNEKTGAVSITTINSDGKSLMEVSTGMIETYKANGIAAEHILSNGGLTSEYEYVNVQVNDPANEIKVVAYFFKFNNDKDGVYRCIEIAYTKDNANAYVNLFQNYTIEINDEVPNDLYNESDYFG